MNSGGTGTAIASVLDFIGPFIVAGLLLYAMGRMRRWLYEHIFKVGWLLTKNLRTTTILFYVFFLPGVLVYEFVFWLAAGFLDVRAERAVTWPEAQQIAELRLNFVRLAKTTGAFRTAVITIVPFVIGTIIIWLVAHDILGVSAFAARLQADGMSDLGGAFEQLFSAPDFFLWVYILFTIGNTMMPHWADLRGGRVVLIGLGVALGIMLALGVGTDIIRDTLVNPLVEAVNLISTVFAITIGVNLIMTALLGLTESIIERITGDSATYQNGKLVAMTRAEVLVYKREQAEREAAARKRQQERQKRAASGPPSIYRLPLPIPGSPGREMRTTSEPISVRRDDSHSLGPGAPGLPAQTMPQAPQPSPSGQPRPQPGPQRPSPYEPGSTPARTSERTTDADDEQDDQRTRPQTPRPAMPAANRPQQAPMRGRSEDDQAKTNPVQPLRPAPYRPPSPTPSQRPATAPGGVRDEDEEHEKDEARPLRPPSYRPPTPTPSQRSSSALDAFRDDDEEEDEGDEARPLRPPSYRPPTPTPAQRSASALDAFRDDDDDEEDGEDEARPMRPAPQRAATSAPPRRTSSALDAFRDDEEDDESDKFDDELDDLNDKPGRR